MGMVDLPDKQLAKAHARCRKWLARIAKALLPFEAYTTTPRVGDETVAFIALNAGVQTGASPFALRQALVTHTWLSDDSFDIHFSSTLPFALVCSREGHHLIGRTSSLTDFVSVNMAPHATGDASVLMVHLAEIALWTGGSSPNHGLSLLYLLCCRRDLVMQALAHVFQPPTFGVELFLTFSNTVDEASGALSMPRVLNCQPVQRVPGLYVIPEFITHAEHDAIWRELRDGAAASFEVESLARRRVAHFNRRFYYGVNRLGDPGASVNPKPQFYDWMRSRLHGNDATVELRGFPSLPECDQLTVNFYDYDTSIGNPSGIAHHVDAHSPFADFVLIVSLGSHTVMEFSRHDRPPESAAPETVLMAPRALVLMTGEARYAWTHGIAEKNVDIVSDRVPPLRRGTRVSLTWRKSRDGPHKKSECMCAELCDGNE